MKDRIGILVIIVIMATILTFMIIFRKKVEIKDIKYMHFSYSVGYAMYSNVNYDLEYKNSKYIAKIKPEGIADEDAKEVEVDEKIVIKLEEILKKYDVKSWDGFDKVDKYVLDGNSFSFSLRLKDESSISASGYMKWPKNYREVRKELDDLFMNLYDKK